MKPGETEHGRGFYTDVLGLHAGREAGRGDDAAGGAWFDINDANQLHISERADAVMHDDMHFGLVVDDFDGVLAPAGRRPARRGSRKPDLFGGRRGSTRDPLGNRIELLEPAGQLALAVAILRRRWTSA